jgi:hypothetical protein
MFLRLGLAHTTDEAHDHSNSCQRKELSVYRIPTREGKARHTGSHHSSHFH